MLNLEIVYKFQLKGKDDHTRLKKNQIFIRDSLGVSSLVVQWLGLFSLLRAQVQSLVRKLVSCTQDMQSGKKERKEAHFKYEDTMY